MRQLLALLLVLVVVLSGCSALTGGPTESPASTPTATPGGTPTPTTVPTPTPTAEPTPRPTDTPTPTPTPGGDEELAPGITREGIVNPVALMSAHQRELLADGYVVNQTVVSTYNGTVSNRLVVETRSGPGGELAYQNATSYGFDYDGTESVIRNSMWLNTTAMTTRHVEGGSTTYQVRERLYPPEALVWFGGLQRDIQFAADDYEVTGVQQREDGPRIVTLSASIDRVAGDGVDDTTSTLRVDGNGVVRYAETEVNYGEGQTYHTWYTVDRLGGVQPEPPAWLDAVPPSAALNVGMDVFEFDETSVQLVHTYGDAAPAGSTVTVVTNGTLYETTLDEPFGDGERYLWVASDGTLRATADRPDPEAARGLGTEVTVTVRAPDGGELFSISIGR